MKIKLCLLSLLLFAPALGQVPADTKPPVKVKISFSSPANVGMPIWMYIDTPNPIKIRYPLYVSPYDFGCNKVEVQKDGKTLAPIIHLDAAGYAGPPCGSVHVPASPQSRLPIHIQYPLTEPGTYLVRYTRSEYRADRYGSRYAPSEQSDWTPLSVSVAPKEEVTKWLSYQLKNIPADTDLIAGDWLPSVLASPTREVLRAVLAQTYNSGLVSMLASNSLWPFNPVEVRAELLAILDSKGPNGALVRVVATTGDLVKPIAEEITRISWKFMNSSDPVKNAATIEMLRTLRSSYPGLNERVVNKIDESLLASLDTVIGQKNQQAAWSLANFLAVKKPPNGTKLLWKLVDANLAVEQSLICITWFHDVSDLPELAVITEIYDDADPHGYKHYSVVDALGNSYGEAARPYLRHILKTSRQTWVRASAAKSLATMNDALGFQFFIDTIQQKPFYYDEMVRWLKQQFQTSLKSADDAALIEYLQKKILSAVKDSSSSTIGALKQL